MKKLIFCLLVMVFCNMVVFASITINNVQNIDLSNVYEHIGDLPLGDESGNQVSYNGNPVIGQITFEGESLSVDNFKLDFGEMVFKTDDGSVRPYEVDIVYKQQVQFQGEAGEYSQSEIIHLGNGQTSETFNIPATDSSVTVGGVDEGYDQEGFIWLYWVLWGHLLN